MLRGAVDVATSVASVYGVYQTQRNHQHALHHSDELHQQAVTHSNDLQGRGIAADTEAHFQQLIACALDLGPHWCVRQQELHGGRATAALAVPETVVERTGLLVGLVDR